MEYALGLYEKAMPADLSLVEKLETTVRCGFDHLELSIDESDEKLARLKDIGSSAAALRAAQAQTGVPIKSICLSGQRRFPMGARDAAVRRTSLELLERALELSCGAGIRLIQLAGYDVYYEQSDENTAAYFYEGLQAAVALAAKYCVTLGFETMETPFMDTVAKAMGYVRRIDSPYLGVYPDIGNLKNAALCYGSDVTEDLLLGRGHIFAAHLKETLPGVYRDMTFGSGGHTEYERSIAALWQAGVRSFTGEFWYKGAAEYEACILAASVFLREKIEKGVLLCSKH